MCRLLIMSLIAIVITCSFFSNPCLAQFDEVYDVPLSVHSYDDESPPWPHIAVDDSGCVYVTCRVNWEIETRKLDSIGTTTWTRIICDGLGCTPHDIALDEDANVYVLGTMDYVFNDTIMGDCNLVLIKYDSSGIHQWTQTYPFSTDIHYPNIQSILGSAESSAVYGQLEVSPDGHSYIWGQRWDRYPVDNSVRRRKNGFLLIYDHTGAERTNQMFVCPIERHGIPGEHVRGVHAVDRAGNVSIAAVTWADLEICPFVSPGNTLDTAYQEAFWLYEADANSSQLYEEQHFRDNIVWESCRRLDDGTGGVRIRASVVDLCIDGLGNKYVLGYLNHRQYDNPVLHSFVVKCDPAWTQLWSLPLSDWDPLYSDMDVDNDGNVVIADNNGGVHQLWRLDPNGNIIGIDPSRPEWSVRMDDAGNAYAGFNGIRKYDTNFNRVWSTWWGQDIYIDEIEVDKKGNVYFTYVNWETVGAVAKFEQTATMVVRDAHNDTIPNVEFELIKVSNDPPLFTEDTLGTFTTDDLGQLKLRMVRTDSLLLPVGPGNDTPDTLAIGDTIKVAKHLHSRPAVKHPGLLSTAYSAHLDNGKFDPDGELSFDTLGLGTFDIVLNHTEIRYNLVASVEWEASFAYLDALQSSFRYMSNYLYDVSDGQVHLDTLVIYDHRQHWDEADILIHAQNSLGPVAYVGGIFRSASNTTLDMNRKNYFSIADRRNLTDVNPLPLVDVSSDYRTKAHEFGHYALGFWDEYMLFDGTSYVNDPSLRCFAFPLSNYGFMDFFYEQHGEKSSEMSSAYRYELSPCQNTKQWGMNGWSCWDQLEAAFEGNWGADAIYAPILKPDADDEEEQQHLTARTFSPALMMM